MFGCSLAETRILLMGMKSGERFGVSARDLFYSPSCRLFQGPGTVVRSTVPESNNVGPSPVRLLPVRAWASYSTSLSPTFSICAVRIS